MHKTLLIALTSCFILAANAADITVISYGGALQKAHNEAFYKPWQKASNHKIIAGEYTGEMAKIKAMVNTNNVVWNVVDIENGDLARACDEGLFEHITPEEFGLKESDLVRGAVTPCGIGYLVYSTALAYNKNKVKTPPKNWADFWDVKTNPGKRSLRKVPKATLEFALMADGVARDDVYKVLATKEGQDRAFKKLDELKPHIQWWEAGAQPPQFLAAGDVVMSSVYNGRLSGEQRAQYALEIVWQDALYEFDAWAIPKGAKDQAIAKEFIKFTMQPKAQKDFAQNIDYGAANLAAANLLSPDRAAQLPTSTANIANQLAVNDEFWIDYGEQLTQRFNVWASK